jgi:hypothetical protein
MKIKPGANIYGLHPMMQVANAIAAVIYREHGQELVITSGNDSKHSANSLHYKSRACDYRTFYFTSKAEAQLVAKQISVALGHDYDVVCEMDHIHCEYDPENPKLI